MLAWAASCLLRVSSLIFPETKGKDSGISRAIVEKLGCLRFYLNRLRLRHACVLSNAPATVSAATESSSWRVVLANA